MPFNDPANPWSAADWNVTAQTQYVKQHGMARAEARARDGGTTLGGARPRVSIAQSKPLDPTNPWSADGWSLSAQVAYLKANGQARAEARARDAGTTLGAPAPTTSQRKFAQPVLVRPGDRAIYKLDDGRHFVPARSPRDIVLLLRRAAIGIQEDVLLSLEQQLEAASELGVYVDVELTTSNATLLDAAMALGIQVDAVVDTTGNNRIATDGTTRITTDGTVRVIIP